MYGFWDEWNIEFRLWFSLHFLSHCRSSIQRQPRRAGKEEEIPREWQPTSLLNTLSCPNMQRWDEWIRWASQQWQKWVEGRVHQLQGYPFKVASSPRSSSGSVEHCCIQATACMEASLNIFHRHCLDNRRLLALNYLQKPPCAPTETRAWIRG